MLLAFQVPIWHDPNKVSGLGSVRDPNRAPLFLAKNGFELNLVDFKHFLVAMDLSSEHWPSALRYDPLK